MNDHSPMPFGLHKGTKLANVPDAYLVFLYEKGIAKGELKEYIEDNLEVLRKDKVKK